MKAGLRGKTLLSLIERSLLEGSLIELEGMGAFELDDEHQVIFKPTSRIRVFLAYAQEDRAVVRRLHNALRDAGFEPWMDHEMLLPGQNWPRAIERTIEVADYFVCCFSRHSTTRRGHFHAELRYALDIAEQMPLEDVFILPVRLNECDVPRHISRYTTYVDLFPDWDDGVARLICTMTTKAAQ